MVDCFTSTAAVYRSKEGRRFALKIIRKQRLSAEQEIALEAEVELLRKIRHPGLVQTVDELDTPNEWFFIVELFAVCIYIYTVLYTHVALAYLCPRRPQSYHCHHRHKGRRSSGVTGVGSGGYTGDLTPQLFMWRGY